MDLSLIAIVDSRRVPPRLLPGWLAAARQGGVTGVQLREKEGSTKEAYAYGQLLMSLARSLDLWVAVDDRLDLALALGADLVHLGTQDLPPEAARKVAPHLPVGLSASNLQELRWALHEQPAYVGFGPVFPTPSKADSRPPTGLDMLAQAVRESPVPVVAIGGVTPERAPQVWACGVAGVAVISALAGVGELSQVTANAKALRSACAPQEGSPHGTS
jgi:thiamine-phosphate pyrophosphorylase